MIDYNKEELIPLTQAPEHLPWGRQGRPVHVSTVWRWVYRGVGGVKLESIKIGGTRYTSREALRRFLDQLNENKTGTGRMESATMSAYMMADHTFEYLAYVAQAWCLDWFPTPGGPYRTIKMTDYAERDRIATVLHDANAKSIEARYGDEPGTFKPSKPPRCWDEIKPATVFGVCACLDYQSCEFDGWETSEACAILLALQLAAGKRMAAKLGGESATYCSNPPEPNGQVSLSALSKIEDAARPRRR